MRSTIRESASHRLGTAQGGEEEAAAEAAAERRSSFAGCGGSLTQFSRVVDGGQKGVSEQPAGANLKARVHDCNAAAALQYSRSARQTGQSQTHTTSRQRNIRL